MVLALHPLVLQGCGSGHLLAWPGLAQEPLPVSSPAFNRHVGLLLAPQLLEGGKGRERCLGAVEKTEITRDQGAAVKVHGNLQMKQAAAAGS